MWVWLGGEPYLQPPQVWVFLAPWSFSPPGNGRGSFVIPHCVFPQLPPEGMFGFHAQYSGCKPNIKTSAGCLGASEGEYQRNLFLQRKRNQQSLCLGMVFSSLAVHTSNNFRHGVFLLLSPFLISISLFHYNKY